MNIGWSQSYTRLVLSDSDFQPWTASVSTSLSVEQYFSQTSKDSARIRCAWLSLASVSLAFLVIDCTLLRAFRTLIGFSWCSWKVADCWSSTWRRLYQAAALASRPRNPGFWVWRTLVVWSSHCLRLMNPSRTASFWLPRRVRPWFLPWARIKACSFAVRFCLRYHQEMLYARLSRSSATQAVLAFSPSVFETRSW